jgi:2'-5' RNA ligase
MRLFIALPVSKEVEEALGKIIFVLKQKGGRVKWVAPKNIHLTVKFLGDVKEDKIGEINGTIEKTANKYPKIISAVDRLGAFPGLTRPRVIWAGLNGGVETIEAIVDDIEDGMAKLGFSREEKRFKPHITLGRVKENYGLGELTDYIKKYQMETLYFEMPSLVLFRSTLTPSGPIYDKLFSANLR